MKTIITTIFIFFIFFANGQSPLQKRTDFSVNRVSIKKALQKLSLTSDINIAFSSNFFKRRKRVSIDAKNQTLESILQHLLKDANVNFAASGEQIILSKAKKKEPSNFTLSGYLEDKESGERLIGARIYAPDYGKGTTSNEYGFYSLTLPKGNTKIVLSYFGSNELIKSVKLTKNLHKDFSLKTSIELSEIVVTSTSPIPTQKDKRDDLPKNNSEILGELGSMPVNDPIQQAELMAGVETGADRFGGLYVRGGNQDQNLMLMDGVPVYNTSHMLGLFSIYNSNTIRNSKLYKGGIPARYGGRVSSVFDVRTKDGNNKFFEGEFSTNVTSASLTVQGPIKKDVSSFFISGRRSLIDYFLQAFAFSEDSDDVEGELIGQRFYDLNIKFNYKLSQKDKLHLSYYGGDDAFELGTLSEDFDIDVDSVENRINLNTKWGNQIFALKWNHLFNPKLFSNTTLTYSKYDFRLGLLQDIEYFNDEEFEFGKFEFGEYESNIQEFGIKMDFDYVHSPKHYFRFGSGVLVHGFNQEVFNIIEQYGTSFNPNIDDLSEENDSTGIDYTTLEVTTFLEDEIKWTDKFTTNLGARLSVYHIEDRVVSFFEPRLIGQYALNKDYLINGTYTRNSQYLHLLTTGISLPIDVWIPSVNDLQPQVAQQFTLGFFKEHNHKLNFSVEAFYKKMKNVIENRGQFFDEETASFMLSDSTFTIGQGRSYGLEFSAHKKFNKAFTFFNYTLSNAERQFGDINSGKWFPFLYDRTHSVRLGFNWQLTKKMNLSSSWSFHSGTPRAIINQLLQFDQTNIAQFNPPNDFNSIRTPYYHRLDVAAQFVFPRKHTTHILKVGAFNVYNRHNDLFYFIVTLQDFNGVERNELESTSFISFFPQLTYTAKFDFSKKNKKTNRGY